MVNVPSFVVRLESQKVSLLPASPSPSLSTHPPHTTHVLIVFVLPPTQHLDYAMNSPLAGGRPGRVKRKRAKAAAGGDEEGAEDEDEE
jgi:hypothetical protein